MRQQTEQETTTAQAERTLCRYYCGRPSLGRRGAEDALGRDRREERVRRRTACGEEPVEPQPVLRREVAPVGA